MVNLRAPKDWLREKTSGFRTVDVIAVNGTYFHLFPALPLELRKLIWSHTLPGPRALQIIRGTPRRTLGLIDAYTTSIPSYGGCLPITLQINRESRTEALLHLTFFLGSFWNFEIDTAIFQVPPGTKYQTDALLSSGQVQGLLGRLKHLALDWHACTEYTGDQATTSTLSSKPVAVNDCIRIVRLLPNLISCTFLYARLTHYQRDMVDYGVAWSIGPLTMGTCQALSLGDVDKCLSKMRESVERAMKADMERFSAEWKGREGLKIEFGAVHDRKRGDRQGNYVGRGKGDMGTDYDFFG